MCEMVVLKGVGSYAIETQFGNLPNVSEYL